MFTETTELGKLEIETILRISRTPGLPEIASDLYKVYCKRLCGFAAPDTDLDSIPGYTALSEKVKELNHSDDGLKSQSTTTSIGGDLISLSAFLSTLHSTKHASIQGSAYATACEKLVALLDKAELASITSSELHAALDAMW